MTVVEAIVFGIPLGLVAAFFILWAPGVFAALRG